MQLRQDIRAVSTLLAVLLILVAAVIGGLVSYMWAIAPFYSTPQNVALDVTGASFQAIHPDYFDVTVLNPSYSPSETNITSIYLKIDGETTFFEMQHTDPILPIPIGQGASVTVRCVFDWGSYAGRSITVNVSPLNGTGGFLQVQTQFVKLAAYAFFNATRSVRYFNVTVQNDQNSIMNLTLTRITLDGVVVLSLSTDITLPRVLKAGEIVSFRCFFDWQGNPQPVVTAETEEGYTATSTQQVAASALLLVSDFQFNETNPDRVSVTLFSANESATPVDVANITVAYGNTTDVISGDLSNPPLPYRLNNGSSVTLDCVWNWNASSYRNMGINVTAYTTQGFASPQATFTTPPEVRAILSQTEFDLNNTSNFSVNITNLPYSLQTVNVTGIDFNGNPTSTDSALIAPGQPFTFLCEFNWSSFLGQNATIAAQAVYGNNISLSVPPLVVTVPYFKVSNVSFAGSSLGTPYMNVTIRNSEFSKENATISQIIVKTENGTQLIDGTISSPKISPSGYLVVAGNEVTVVCPWDWSPYVGKDLTVIVQTADGFQASESLRV